MKKTILLLVFLLSVLWADKSYKDLNTECIHKNAKSCIEVGKLYYSGKGVM